MLLAARSARSGRRTSRIVTAEMRNVKASIAIVAPGPIVAARRPASAGPMIQPTLNTASKIALARATCVPADEPRHRRGVGGQPQDAQHLHRERHEQDERDRGAVERTRRSGMSAVRIARPRSRREHHLPPVPAVRVGARRTARRAGPGAS